MNRPVSGLLSGTLCLMGLLLSSCSSDGDGGFFDQPRVVGSGIVVSEGRSVAPFHSIELTAVAEVLVTQAGSQNLLVETDDNLIGHIFTSVSNGVLTISSDVEYTTVHGVIVTIDMTDVQSLSLPGVGSITGQNDFTIDDLVVTLAGVGNITVSGTADTLIATMDGVTGGGNPAGIDAENLQTATSNVVLSGVGDCRVHATQVLNATISGTGNIYYAGNPPTVNETITGLGSVIPI